jgi:hypothetical protein
MVMSIKIRIKRWRFWSGVVVAAVIVVETGKVKVVLAPVMLVL